MISSHRVLGCIFLAILTTAACLCAPAPASSQTPRKPFKVAAVEFNPHFFEFEGNIPPITAIIEKAASAGAKIIVLPETSTTGYIYKDRAQFEPFLDTVPGKTTAAIEAVTKKYDCYVTIGIAEIDRATGLAYNTGALIGPAGYIGKYRKVGLNWSDQLWFTPGNVGYPVFDTPYGKIAMEICYDDTYWEISRVPAIKGAQILCYMTSSDRLLTQDKGSRFNHSTVAAVQYVNAWNGMALIAADRNNSETNPTTGVTVWYGGASAIWSPRGKKLAQAPAGNPDAPVTTPPVILYATIDPAEYDNPQRATLQERRPELYGSLAFFRAPYDPVASTVRREVAVSVAQYSPVKGHREANCAKAQTMLKKASWKAGTGRLLVLPEYSLTGPPADGAEAHSWAEPLTGESMQMMAGMANRTGCHLVYSFLEKESEKIYVTAVLLGPGGKVAGTYRKTHLTVDEKRWATAGRDLPVFDTALGRIGLLSGSDCRFPEASGVLSVKRADIIAIPSSWRGDYGGFLTTSEELYAITGRRYPKNTMNFWFAIAKTAQAFTVAANFAGSGFAGSSGLFTLNPVNGNNPPLVASPDQEELFTATFTTLAEPGCWMSQEKLIVGRRVDLLAPLTFPLNSAVFKAWEERPGFDRSLWEPFRQNK